MWVLYKNEVEEFQEVKYNDQLTNPKKFHFNGQFVIKMDIEKSHNYSLNLGFANS